MQLLDFEATDLVLKKKLGRFQTLSVNKKGQES